MANRGESEVLNENKSTYEHFRDHWNDCRDNSEKSHAYVLGKQWDDADIAALEKANMPYLTKNIIIPVVNKLTGIERRNRTSLVVSPTEQGMEEVAWAMTRLNFHFANSSEMKWEYLLSYAFLLGIISDMGAYLRLTHSRVNDPFGTISMRVIPGFNILKDPHGRQYDLSEDKRVIYTTWWTVEEALSAYPDKAKEIAGLQKYKSNIWGTLTRKTGERTDFRDDKKTTSEGRYRLIELWKLNRKVDSFYYDPFDQKKYRPETLGDFEQLKFYNPQVMPMKTESRSLECSVSFGENVILYSGPGDIQNGQHVFIPFYPYFMDGDLLGTVTPLRGYQDEHNKAGSSILHILNTQANSGWISEEGSVDREVLENAAGSGVVIEYKGNKPDKIQPAILPAGEVFRDETSKRGVYETSGLGENMMGRADSDRESGKLYGRRIEEGYQMLEQLFDNWALTKELIGARLIWMYQNKLSTEKIIQVLMQEGKPETQAMDRMLAEEIVSNVNHGKYNVISENAARSATAKEREDTMLYQLSKVTPPDIVPWDEIWEAGGTPKMKRIAQKMREKLGVANEAQQALGALQQQQAEQPQ